MHTKEKLALELERVGLVDMAARARQGLYHDFESPLDFPELQLAADLATAATDMKRELRQRHQALELRQRALNDEFAASADEGLAWAMGEDGQRALAAFKKKRPRAEREQVELGLPAAIDTGEIRNGPCCICGVDGRSGNIVLLDFKGTVPGTGWGCVACNTPMDGAAAVLCDSCLELYQGGAPIVDICDGFAGNGRRVKLSGFAKIPFGHKPGCGDIQGVDQ